jgi:hypothetical protein
MKRYTAFAAFAVLALALLFAVGCTHAPTQYANVTLMTSQPWPVGLAKTCFVQGDSANNMRMHCAAFGDPGTDDGTLYLVDAVFNKPIRNPGGVYGVTCRLDSFKHATCNSGENK